MGCSIFALEFVANNNLSTFQMSMHIISQQDLGRIAEQKYPEEVRGDLARRIKTLNAEISRMKNLEKEEIR